MIAAFLIAMVMRKGLVSGFVGQIKMNQMKACRFVVTNSTPIEVSSAP